MDWRIANKAVWRALATVALGLSIAGAAAAGTAKTGKLDEVDVSARTVSIAGTAYRVTAQSVLLDGSRHVGLDDVAAAVDAWVTYSETAGSIDRLVIETDPD